MDNPKRYLVTAALPYANGPLHVGHLAGAYLPADVYVRFLRLIGKDVLFICGSDEHGAAITMKAKKEGVAPQEIIDRYHNLFQLAFQKSGISFDIYHRTSSKLHHETSQDFFRTLYKQGRFDEKVSEQYFDEEEGHFLADRYITGTCPKCGYESAYGDQCENCGSSLSPTDLINPRSTLSGSNPVLKKTAHWYLPLDQYADWLNEWILEGTSEGIAHHDPQKWKNHVLGQCKSWLEGGLEARAMTRDLDWGVDVPEEIEGSAGKKMYVWLDAPIGYISATRQWAVDNEEDLPDGKDSWKKYWQDDESALVHFIGKDNIVFHCIIFPVILKAHGDYVLPINVPANQFMNLEGQKISTSRNWAVWVHEFAEEMPDYIDVLRYYMIKHMPEQKDSEFTWKGFKDANDNELVNNLSNFINRVIVLTNKYYGGVLPDIDEYEAFVGPSNIDEYTYIDAEILRIYDYLFDLHQHMLAFDFRAALKVVMKMATYGNQLLQNNEPWKLQKSEPDLVKSLLFHCNQLVAILSLALRPFLPDTADRLRKMLGMSQIREEGEILDIMNTLAEGGYALESGHQIGKGEHLFRRIDEELIRKQEEKLRSSSVEENSTYEHEPLKKEIDFGDFTGIDLRTGTIIAAEKVRKAKKLLKLTIDLGFEKRTIVAGIAEFFSETEVIGQRVTVVANLAPKTLRGVDSEGMILMGSRADGSLQFIQAGSNMENGMVVS